MSSWSLGFVLAVAAAAPVLAQGQKAPKRERNQISREELVQAAESFSNLSDAIHVLRPHFLNTNNRGTRGMSGAGGESDPSSSAGGSYTANAYPVVYLDGRRLGEIGALRDIRTREVESVRYLTPNEASTQYGMGHEAGAILVKLYRADKP